MLRQQNPSDVEVAITPEELEGLDEASIQGLYNQRVAEERARNAREVGFALMVTLTVLKTLNPNSSIQDLCMLCLDRQADTVPFAALSVAEQCQHVPSQL